MSRRPVGGFGIALAAAAMMLSSAARAEITVMMSGGFALAYRELLPAFERRTGIAVTTTSGASQGTGPTTIRAQLERGARADVVILSREGLDEIAAAGRIVDETAVGLARAPLGAAVRAGSPRPDLGTAAALRACLLGARLISMPGSTSGLFIRDDVLPRLGIADRVAVRMTARGVESTAMLAAGESDLALGPVSELVGQPGIDYAGPLPGEFQLVQEFTAAIVRGSGHAEEARELIAFLSSGEAAAAIERAGMERAGPHGGR